MKGWGESVSRVCVGKNTINYTYIQYFLTLVLFTFCTCCVLRCFMCFGVCCLVCIVVSCLVCIVVSCLVCIVVVVLCVLLSSYVYCCTVCIAFFLCRTAG